ncbi:MAG: tetratricopeptide repeat protein [Bacteroidales bacterium]|nr:tetratricopeptide repeat protein [Bacteroidales bacterium]
MGSVKIALGDYEGALADYSVAITLDPQFYIAYNNRGAAKYFMGQPDSAMVDFDSALAILGNYVPAMNNKAASLSKNAMYKESLSLLTRLLKAIPALEKPILTGDW